MAWSKQTRISLMLAIDVVFFIVELTVGLLVSSLALLADAFHMLNDIISLCVGLWAVRVANKATTDKYSYGWLRAEILGAFFNAVFLIALCVSILLEAIGRFFDPPEIDNPKLMLIVGSLGLASNLVGFVILGGHGHDHGHGGHDHGDHDHPHSHEHAAEEGRAIDVLPEVAVAKATNPETPNARRIRFDNESGKNPANTAGHAKRKSQQRSRRSIDDMNFYPSSFRQDIIDASRPNLQHNDSAPYDSETDNSAQEDQEPAENTPLLSSGGASGSCSNKATSATGGKKTICKGTVASGRPRQNSTTHHNHNHNKDASKKKKSSGGHGHNHADMGLNGLILHVIGDALGNVGVIATALIIWLTDWPGKNYADPAVSLFITLIILKSALPLTMATSKVLLQATPDHIDLNEIREDIQALPGVISCHHVHIWQLSDTKIVASMHIQVSFPITAEGGERYMALAKSARKCLHAYGIHSATIQPEFCLADDHSHDDDPAAADGHPGSTGLRMDGAGGSSGAHNGAPDGDNGSATCLLECVDDCVGMGCCSTGTTVAGSEPPDSPPKPPHSHSHGDHSHAH